MSKRGEWHGCGRDEFHFFIILRPFLVEKQFFAEKNFSPPFITKWRREREREGGKNLRWKLKIMVLHKMIPSTQLKHGKRAGSERSENIIHQFELFCHYYHSISSSLTQDLSYVSAMAAVSDKKQFHHHPLFSFTAASV